MDISEFLIAQKQKLAQSSNRCILAIDCSTQLASVCLSFQGKTIFNEDCFRQKSHSEWINDSVERAITKINDEWEKIDVIAISNGPGSFTGVRVATNLAKTLAFAKNIPLVSFSSLDLLAEQSESLSQDSQYVLPMINAFKNMVFWCLYQNRNGNLERITESQATPIVDLEKELEQKGLLLKSVERFQLIGDGYEVYKTYLDQCEQQARWTRPKEPKDYPLASTMVKVAQSQWEHLALIHWRSLIPNYIRASAAEEAKAQK